SAIDSELAVPKPCCFQVFARPDKDIGKALLNIVRERRTKAKWHEAFFGDPTGSDANWGMTGFEAAHKRFGLQRQYTLINLNHSWLDVGFDVEILIGMPNENIKRGKAWDYVEDEHKLCNLALKAQPGRNQGSYGYEYKLLSDRNSTPAVAHLRLQRATNG